MSRRVAVRNATRDRLLAERAGVASGSLRRAVGLIGRRDRAAADGLVVEPCTGVHTVFMRLPIDVVHLRAGGEVLRLLPAMRPWRLGPLVPGSRWVLEVPAGTIEASGIRIGDRLRIEDAPP